MSTNDVVYYKPVELSASGLVFSGKGCVGGVFCASSTSGTLKLWDNTAASGTVLVNTFTLTAGTWYPLPFQCVNGLYATIANTADVTFGYLPLS